MSVISIVELKQKIAVSDDFSLEERKLLQRALDLALARKPAVDIIDVHVTPNYLGRIEMIWAALSFDEGGEGICAAPFGNMAMALVAADKGVLDRRVVPAARRIATLFNKPVRLAKFTKREDVEIYQPNGNPDAET